MVSCPALSCQSSLVDVIGGCVFRQIRGRSLEKSSPCLVFKDLQLKITNTPKGIFGEGISELLQDDIALHRISLIN